MIETKAFTVNERIAARFWSKVNRDGPVPAHRQELGPCWVWLGGRLASGYGQFHTIRSEGPVKAHRFSWALTHGQIRGHWLVCHKCDNRECVRPDHMFLGTCADNLRDAACKGRMATGPRNGANTRPDTHVHGERSPAAKLKEDDVRQIRERFSSGLNSKSELARAFSVSNALIGMIVRREKWKHVA